MTGYFKTCLGIINIVIDKTKYKKSSRANKEN